VRGGAQLLAVPSNNATYGEMMSEQQLAFSKLRAVELAATSSSPAPPASAR
jgi:apolipoprotein N-acyltransferase